ncbi:hypothetical protein BDV93DRAFT_543631 [Ceratobasidium sp. AG-I]|nr:hypothetical protein BDV93DRAFT_543631 [Ceratobasidium sp. AG-I]
MAPIFKTPSGLPLAIYLEPSSSNRAASLRSIRANGGGICLSDSGADVVLIDADSPNGRLLARRMCTDSDSVVLFHEWINACVDAGKLLNAEFNWGSLRIQDPVLVDESLYGDVDEGPAQAQSSVKKEEQSSNHTASSWAPNKLDLVASSDHSSSFVSGGAHATTSPDRSFNDGEIPQLSRSLSRQDSEYSQPDEPTPEKKSSSFPSPTVNVLPPFGQPPADPRLAELFLSACNEWEALKQTAGSTSPTRTGLLEPVSTSDNKPHQRGSSIDPPDRVYEPLARRPRPSHEHASDSAERGPKRRKLSDHGLQKQKGLRSKGPPLVSVPGTGPEDRLKTSTPDAADVSGSSSTLNPVQKVFQFLGAALQFWLQVDLPDRGGVVRLIKKHGGRLAATMEAASYVIVSKAAPQYVEIVVDAEAADRVAVPVAWIHECIKTNKLAPVDDYAVGPPPESVLSEATDGDLSEAEIIQAALATDPPTPPQPVIKKYGSDRKHSFTDADRAYVHRFLAWKLHNDPKISVAQILKDLGKTAPHHTRHSWHHFYYAGAGIDSARVRRIVADLAP